MHSAFQACLENGPEAPSATRPGQAAAGPLPLLRPQARQHPRERGHGGGRGKTGDARPTPRAPGSTALAPRPG